MANLVTDETQSERKRVMGLLALAILPELVDSKENKDNIVNVK